MKRVGLAVVLVVAVGCSPREDRKTEWKAAPAPDYVRVDAAEAAAVKGTVRFEGKLPAAKRISMESEEGCEKLQSGPVYEERVVAGKKGGLANVFVYVKAGVEGKAFEPPKEAVVLEQRGCRFVPRVVALRAGQTLAVKNSDPVSHNIHPMPKNNRDWNQQQAPGAADLQRRFARPEVMIPVKCNIHSWMKSYIGVLEHPFFAVTDGSGEFTLSGLPAGSYVIGAWHEALGESEEQVVVGKGQTATVGFVFRGGRLP